MKPKTYWYVLFNSFILPAYYLSILNTKLKFSLRFFLVSYVLLSLLATILFVVVQIPRWEMQLKNSAQEVVASFPSDLQIAWDGKMLHATNSQPLSIGYPKGFSHENLPNVLAYLDTTTDSLDTVNHKTSSHAFFVVTQSHLYVNGAENNSSNLELNQIYGFEKSFTITKGNITGYARSVKTFIQQALEGSVVFYPFGFFMFMVASRLFSLLLDSVLIFYLLRVFRKPFPYWKVYQVGLHICVVAEFVELLTTRFVPNTGLPMFALAFWGYAIFIFSNLRNVKAVEIGG